MLLRAEYMYMVQLILYVACQVGFPFIVRPVALSPWRVYVFLVTSLDSVISFYDFVLFWVANSPRAVANCSIGPLFFFSIFFFYFLFLFQHLCGSLCSFFLSILAQSEVGLQKCIYLCMSSLGKGPRNLCGALA